MAEVVVIRPGCTDYDEQHRVQGSLELPLNDRGEDQVLRLVELVRDVPLTAIYASPDDPARSTAETLGRELDVPLHFEDELRNVDQGLWQGLHIDEIRRLYPRVARQWRDEPSAVCPPEGEPILDAAERLEHVLGRPLKRNRTFAVVVSEPLATLVRCVVTDGDLELPDSMCGDEEGELAEIVPIGAASSNGTKQTENPEQSEA